MAAALVLAGLAGFLFSPAELRHRMVSLGNAKDGTVLERKELWGESLRMIQKSPVLGLGLNTYARNEPLYKPKDIHTDFQYAHNGYLQMAAETGLFGLLSFLAVVVYFLIAALAAFFKNPATFLGNGGSGFVFGVLAFLTHSATDTDLHSLLLVNLLWLAMGVAWAAKCLARAETR